MDVFGQNDSGDFDQYSIAGVDFGQNYDENYGVMPTNLKGDTLMYGADFDQMGIVPEMGNVVYTPEMGHHQYKQLGYSQQLGYAQQLGAPNYTMGGMVDDLRMQWAMLPQMQKTAVYVALALVALITARKMGFIKQKLPLIG